VLCTIPEEQRSHFHHGRSLEILVACNKLGFMEFDDVRKFSAIKFHENHPVEPWLYMWTARQTEMVKPVATFCSFAIALKKG
jgi:hypothetical protein